MSEFSEKFELDYFMNLLIVLKHSSDVSPMQLIYPETVTASSPLP